MKTKTINNKFLFFCDLFIWNFIKIIFILLIFTAHGYSKGFCEAQIDSVKILDPNYSSVNAKTISSASVFLSPDFGSEIINSIPKKSKIQVYDVDGVICKISYEKENKFGYIHSICIENTDDFQRFKDFCIERREKQKAEELKIEQDKYRLEQEKVKLAREERNRTQKQAQVIYEKKIKQVEKQRQIEINKAIEKRKKRLITSYGINITNKLLINQIWIGMTSPMLIEVLGRPDDINRTVTMNVTSEQFVYKGISKYRFYYFNNGILTSWQD